MLPSGDRAPRDPVSRGLSPVPIRGSPPEPEKTSDYATRESARRSRSGRRRHRPAARDAPVGRARGARTRPPAARMSHHEHHFRNLGRARDHLTETMVSLQSAVERMTGDDWIDATVLLRELTEDIGPRLARLRTAASERFDEHTRLGDFDEMRTGRLPFPDERLQRARARRAAAGAGHRTPAAPPRGSQLEGRRRAGGEARRDRRGDDGLPARQRRVRSHPGVPLRQHRQAAAWMDPADRLSPTAWELRQRRRERQHGRPPVRREPAAATSPRPARGGSSPRGPSAATSARGASEIIGLVNTRPTSLAHTGQAIDAGAVPIGLVTSNEPSRSHRYS